MQYLRRASLALAGLLLATAAHADPTVLGTTHLQVALPPNTQVTVIAPADNVHGITVTSAVVLTESPGVVDMQTAPDGILIFGAGAGSGSTVANLPYPIYLPAGVGLFAVVTSSGAAWVTYQLN